jgi:hypothetical protein
MTKYTRKHLVNQKKPFLREAEVKAKAKKRSKKRHTLSIKHLDYLYRQHTTVTFDERGSGRHGGL